MRYWSSTRAKRRRLHWSWVLMDLLGLGTIILLAVSRVLLCLLVTVSISWTDRNSFSGLTAVTRANTLPRTEELEPDLDCLDLKPNVICENNKFVENYLFYFLRHNFLINNKHTFIENQSYSSTQILISSKGSQKKHHFFVTNVTNWGEGGSGDPFVTKK